MHFIFGALAEKTFLESINTKKNSASIKAISGEKWGKSRLA